MRLPLYSPRPPTPEGLPRTASCDLCTLSNGAPQVCLPAHGATGGLLYITDYLPSPHKDIKDPRPEPPMSSPIGKWVRSLISRAYDGPVAYDAALRCRTRTPVPQGKAGDAPTEACRVYTHSMLRDASPERIIVESERAAASVLGQSYGTEPPRRAYSFTPEGVPVFILQRPSRVRGNRLREERYKEDLEWALTAMVVQDKGEYLRATVGDLKELHYASKEGGALEVDVETFGRHYNKDFRVVTLALQALDRSGGPQGPVMVVDTDYDTKEVVEATREVLVDPQITKWAYNSKYDQLSCEQHFDCYYPVGEWKDTMLLGATIEVGAPKSLAYNGDRVGAGGHKDKAAVLIKEACTTITRGRKALLKARTKATGANYSAIVRGTAVSAASKHALRPGEAPDGRNIKDWITALTSTLKPQAYAYALVNRDVIYCYNARDTRTSAHLHKKDLATVMEDETLRWNWTQLVEKSAGAVARMESCGMPVDRDAMEIFATLLDQELADVEARFKIAYGDDFNPASPSQVAEILFTQRGHLPTKVGKTGPSVSKAILEELAKDDVFAKDILEYRAIVKMQSNYARGLSQYVREDGRIHPSIRIGGTETSRVSCADPNLQTIPSRGEYAKRAKSCFAVGPGRVLVQADYSQIELRVAAHLSGDKEMIRIYKEGRDYHGETATIISPTAWGREWIAPAQIYASDAYLSGDEDAKKLAHLMADIRRAAKIVNFGLLYGMGDMSLAAQTGVPEDKVGIIRKTILGNFRGLDAWIKGCVRTANRCGYAYTTWDGKKAHRRYLPDMAIIGDGKMEKKDRAHAERASWNTPVQGSAAGYTTASVTAGMEWIEESGIDAKLCLQVHDSIIGDVALADKREYIREMARIMTQWDLGEVPLVVDFEVGTAWGALEEVNLQEYL